MRRPRPYPSWRRARSTARSSALIVNPAGTPSTMMTRAGPCDSPAVRNRNIAGHSIEVSAMFPGSQPHESCVSAGRAPCTTGVRDRAFGDVLRSAVRVPLRSWTVSFLMATGAGSWVGARVARFPVRRLSECGLALAEFAHGLAAQGFLLADLRKGRPSGPNRRARPSCGLRCRGPEHRAGHSTLAAAARARQSAWTPRCRSEVSRRSRDRPGARR